MQQGKHGWYPCDYDTYRKLKALNMAYDKALHSYARWERWNKKQPQNRVIRAKIKDSKGNVVGYKAPIPLPEPIIVNEKLLAWKIYEDYRKARFPAQAADACSPLALNVSDIDNLYKEITK